MKTIAFFNNKGGVGKTTLVYHLAWMFADLGARVVAVDLDPQSNLTSAFLSDDRIDDLMGVDALLGGPPRSVLGALARLRDRLGDLEDPFIEQVSERLWLVPGDLALSLFEDRLAEAWPRCLDDNQANRYDAFRVTTAFRRLIDRAAAKCAADIVLIDVGPSLAALNRAALIAADNVVIPLAADLFSLRGLQNVGPSLRGWRAGWKTRRDQDAPFDLPAGTMAPIGYVVMQHQERGAKPAKAHGRWMARIPETYATSLLGVAANDPSMASAELGTLKHFHSLMPLAQDARKPIFHLTAADGALGSYAVAARSSAVEFAALARKIADRCGVVIP